MVKKGESQTQLKHLKQEYKILVEASRDCIFRLDRDERFVFVNQKLCELTGEDELDLIGRKFTEVFRKLENKSASEQFERTGLIFEAILRDNHGNERIMEVNQRFLKTDHVITSLDCIARDVTDRRILEEELREVQEYFKSVFNSLSDGLVIVNDEYKIVNTNQSFLNTYKTNLDKIIFTDFNETFQKLGIMGEDNTLISLIEDAIESDHSILTSHSFIDEKGEEKTFELAASPLRISNSDSKRVILSLRDISDKVSLLEQIQESERKFLDLAESVEEVIYILDFKNKRYKYISPIITKILGYELDLYYKSNWEERIIEKIHPEDVEIFQKNYQKLVEGNLDKPFLQVRVRIQKADGDYAWLQNSIHPIYDEEGNLAQLEGIIKDITEDKQYRRILQEKNTALRNELEALKSVKESHAPDLIVTSITKGIAFLSPGGKYNFVNQAFCDIIRLEREKVINKHFFDVPIGENWQEVKSKIWHKISSEEKKNVFEQEISFEYEKSLDFQFTTHKVREKNTLVEIGTVLLVQDNTRKKLARARHKITKKIIKTLTTLPIEESFEKMFQYLEKVIDFDISNISIVNPENSEQLLIIKDFAKSIIEQIHKGFLYETQGTASQVVVKTQSPVIVNNVADSNFATTTILLDLGIHSFICYPLIQDEKVIATLNLQSHSPHSFTEVDLRILEDISYVASYILKTNLGYRNL